MEYNKYLSIEDLDLQHLPAFVGIGGTIGCKRQDIEKNIGKKTIKGAKIALNSLRTSLKIIERFRLPLLVSMPVCKETAMKIDSNFLGQTEFLAKYFHIKSVYQAYISDKFFYVLLTAHIPLKKVTHHIKQEKIYRLLSVIFKDCKMSKDTTTIGMLCVNPHCGEFLNTKEEEKIEKIIDNLKEKGIKVIGPVTYEHSIKLFEAKRINICIGIYHDQVITPLKIHTKNRLLEMNIGLPIKRVGPVHGVGFDIGGEFNPDYTSAKFTLERAHKIAQNLVFDLK